MTALRNACTDTDTVLDIDSALDIDTYPKPYTIDSEVVNVVGGGHALSVTVERGAGGSTAAAHVNGTALTAANAFSGGGATPTLAEVLVAGNDPAGTLIFAANGASGFGGFLEAAADGGSAGAGGGDGLAGHAGGDGYLYGGGGNGAGTGAQVLAGGGLVDGTGGPITLFTRGGAGGTGTPGGDVQVITGAGDGAGRDGLVFLNLPTSNPAVAGALYSDAGVVKVSAG